MLSQSQRLPPGPSGASGYPPKEEQRRGGSPPTRVLSQAWRKKLEAQWDSACAALAAVDRELLSEEEEEEEKEVTPGNRSHASAFSNIRASTPGAHGTPFVSRKGDGNDRSNKRNRDKAYSRTEWKELPSLDAEDGAIIDALRQRSVRFFHAGGSDYPHKSATRGGGYRFSHDKDVVPCGLYPRRNTPTQGPQLTPGMLTALETLSAYTVEEGGASAGTSRVSRA